MQTVVCYRLSRTIASLLHSYSQFKKQKQTSFSRKRTLSINNNNDIIFRALESNFDNTVPLLPMPDIKSFRSSCRIWLSHTFRKENKYNVYSCKHSIIYAAIKVYISSVWVSKQVSSLSSPKY
jgi:hypothetical protein